MARKFYNRKDFRAPLSASQVKVLSERRARVDAMGEQVQYDVFLCHSTEDIALIKAIRDVLEYNFDISVYIDWDEDAGTPRYEIADVVKAAMNRSRTFLIVKTDNSDESQWVPWETGYFDKKDDDKIGVLLIEDDESKFNHETFEHREYLRNYIILGPEDIVDFIKNGSSFVERRIDPSKLASAPFLVVRPEKMVHPHRND